MRPLALLPLFALAACATPSQLARVPGTSLSPIPAAYAWNLAVTGCARPLLCREVRTALVGQLVSRDLAARVVPDSRPAPITMAVTILGTEPASAVQQTLYGAVAGSSRIEARVDVLDRRGPAPVPLRQFTVRSASVVHPSGNEAGLQDEYTRFATEIADGLGR